MRVIDAVPGSKIYVGQQLEDKATMVRFDASPFYSLYGDDGTFSLRVQRYGEAEGYPIGYPSVYAEDGYVCWILGESDAAIAGENEVQLRYITDDAVSMSMKFVYVVKESIVTGETIPAPMKEWAEAIIAAAAEIAPMPEDMVRVPTAEALSTVLGIENGAVKQMDVDDLLEDVNEAIQDLGDDIQAVADERPIVSVSVSEQITRQVLINALNANNSLIPSGKEVSLIITGINGQIAHLSVFKTNSNYGEAVGLSYYSTNKFKLENGTWAYEAFGSVGRLAVDVSGLEINISDGHGSYYSDEIPVNLPSGAIPISASWYGIFDAGCFPQVRDNAKIIFQSTRALTIGSSRTVIVGYYIP